MAIDVIATQRGLYGRIREKGEPFTIAKKQDFSKRWMRKVQVVDSTPEGPTDNTDDSPVDPLA